MGLWASIFLSIKWSVCGCVTLLPSWPTLCDHLDYSWPGSSVCRILQARILERVALTSRFSRVHLCATSWTVVCQDSPGKNTGVGCHFLLQGIFLTQGSSLRLLSLLGWQAGSLPPASPKYWVMFFCNDCTTASATKSKSSGRTCFDPYDNLYIYIKLFNHCQLNSQF